MLFPNTEVRMKTTDKLVIGVPAAISGVVVVSSKLGATMVLLGAAGAFWLGVRDEPVVIDQTALIALATGFAALGAYLWKQFSNFKNRKILFMKALADNLYFRNLDNNVGVFHRLIDDAEEEESKEVILASYFLLTRGEATADQLDQVIEAWLQEQGSDAVDFEVSDALAKLKRLGLAEQQDDGRWRSVPLDAARAKLDVLWDDQFQFA